VRGRTPLASILALLVAGCGATGIANSVVIDMDRVRSSSDVQASARLAPQEFALAENERALARKAAKDGDETADALYAAQAIASYTDAVVLARLARATVLSDQAGSDLAREQARAQKLGSERASAEQEAD
jgi:hypothetical protein